MASVHVLIEQHFWSWLNVTLGPTDSGQESETGRLELGESGAWSIWRTSQCCQPKPKPWLHVYVCEMTCPFSFFCLFVFLFFVCVCLCLPLWLTDANTPKKCRALFGLDQLSSWCKPCRYNCCSTSGRKTSTMSSLFYYHLISCSDIPKTCFHHCGNRWQTLLLFYFTEELPAINSLN